MSLLQKSGTFFRKALHRVKDMMSEEDSGYFPTPFDLNTNTLHKYSAENVAPIAPRAIDSKSNHPFQVIPTPKNVTKYDNIAPILMNKMSVEIRYNSNWFQGNALVLESWLVSALGVKKNRIRIRDKAVSSKSGTKNLVKVNFTRRKFGNASMNGRYRVTIDARRRKVQIEAQDPEGAAYAVSTLLQLLEERSKKELAWPNIILEDWPSTPDEYRGLMLDIAREYHSIQHLQSIIDLCSLYKLRYLHLHLTDNENFMIPPPASKFYAGVNLSEIGKAKYNKHGKPAYTIQELMKLNLYAFSRGVILVPELDIPGHSEALIRSSPKLLGTYVNGGKKRVRSLLNFANEKVTKGVISPMITHVTKLFPYSPYIHVGFDEVDVTNADQDSHFRKTVGKKKGIGSSKELLWDFMALMNKEVKSLNITSWYPPPTIPGMVKPVDPSFYQPTRTCIVWESFSPQSTPAPPKDILVMTWSMQEYQPDHLLKDGFSVINGAWSPLYMVGSNGSSVKDILKWQGRREFGGIPEKGKTKWVTVPKDTGKLKGKPKVHGASIVLWEAVAEEEIGGLKGRIGAMSERMWTPDLYNTPSSFGNGMLPLFESRLTGIGNLVNSISGK
ncbi:hypothetical protein K7432_009778 [Basidiobolus ranarum]|uniref:beta-N-acetylhexosaminidase n=1 Tax=Basidiobolus ranarum TaxID=34480 RepID=A0ABR2VWJ4_9FUNG